MEQILYLEKQERESRDNHNVKTRAQDRNFSRGNWAPIQRKLIAPKVKDEREKPLLFKRHKVVRFLISPKKKKVKIEVNKIMNPAFSVITFPASINNP